MSLRLPVRYLSSLLNAPQMIEPAAGAAVLSVLAPNARLDGWDGDADNDAREFREYQVVNGVAVIPVIGELVHRGASLRPLSGMCSYQAIDDAVVSALNDGGIRELVFEYDTPGGQADGCLDLSERLRGYRGVKPMTAVINVRATSAGIALASSCDKVFITKSGFAGSIGVVAYHTDISRLLDEKGVKITYLYAGARKIDGAPELPLSDEAFAEFQKRIDLQYDRFCEVVAANRAHAGLTVDAVRATEARIYLGGEAIDAGLADGFSTLEDVISMAETRTSVPGARLSGASGGTETSMQAGDDKPFTPCKDCTDDAGCKGKGECAKAKADAEGSKAADPVAIATMCHQAGYPELIAGLIGKGSVTVGMVTADIDRAKAIADAAQKLGASNDLARKLIGEGVSETTARALLTDAMASRDVHIDTTRPTGGATAAATAGPDYRTIYGRMNGINQKG
ncbi:S49 family peptidase [Azospirillum rugosum]|uniref:ClpP class serine protease n=1 Tax=Azospirillum rugosum TaxID=416170 RepID=A0ABS4SG27_9PROT|nr:S49 family peptidase [Azospirillum rugosum]MBP2291038.1 ClpP class serine protease [Azospirillum rugosum]MDQ0524898.1 ClpP class serine protease [Azospirillum rugosum]